jgi:hypothetical protein
MNTAQPSAINMHKEYAFVVVFNRTYDMGESVRATARVRQSVSRDGIWLIIEPLADD